MCQMASGEGLSLSVRLLSPCKISILASRTRYISLSIERSLSLCIVLLLCVCLCIVFSLRRKAVNKPSAVAFDAVRGGVPEFIGNAAPGIGCEQRRSPHASKKPEYPYHGCLLCGALAGCGFSRNRADCGAFSGGAGRAIAGDMAAGTELVQDHEQMAVKISQGIRRMAQMQGELAAVARKLISPQYIAALCYCLIDNGTVVDLYRAQVVARENGRQAKIYAPTRRNSALERRNRDHSSAAAQRNVRAGHRDARYFAAFAAVAHNCILTEQVGYGWPAEESTGHPSQGGGLHERTAAAPAAWSGQIGASGHGQRAKGHERGPLQHFRLDNVKAMVQLAILRGGLGLGLGGLHVDEIAGLLVLAGDELLGCNAFQVANVQILLAVQDGRRVLVLIGQDGTGQGIQIGVVEGVLGGHGRFQLEHVTVSIAAREAAATTGSGSTGVSVAIAAPAAPGGKQDQQEDGNTPDAEAGRFTVVHSRSPLFAAGEIPAWLI
nr:MAG TPA: hypothetical protein [Caudoviricetes sp.]